MNNRWRQATFPIDAYFDRLNPPNSDLSLADLFGPLIGESSELTGSRGEFKLPRF